jgi:hypothetical protein
MEDVNTSSDTQFKDDLIKWAVHSFQFYLAAGCDQVEFSKLLPSLIGLLRNELAETADLCRHTAETAQKDQKSMGRDFSSEIAEDLAQAEAADRLVDRMHEASRK